MNISDMFLDISEMIEEMGFPSPVLYEPQSVWVPKLYNFVKFVYDKWDSEE